MFDVQIASILFEKKCTSTIYSVHAAHILVPSGKRPPYGRGLLPDRNLETMFRKETA